MTAAEVAAALGGARRSGAQWLARCPVHLDRSPSLALRDDGSWRVLVHCHAGCTKADVEPQRMALGSITGAVIKISADDDVTIGLGICEGIEDAIAVLKAGWRPIWCCLSAGNLGCFPVLPGIEALTVFADADQPGM